MRSDVVIVDDHSGFWGGDYLQFACQSVRHQCAISAPSVRHQCASAPVRQPAATVNHELKVNDTWKMFCPVLSSFSSREQQLISIFAL
jgi:hypothetical protein